MKMPNTEDTTERSIYGMYLQYATYRKSDGHIIIDNNIIMAISFYYDNNWFGRYPQNYQYLPTTCRKCLRQKPVKPMRLKGLTK